MICQSISSFTLFLLLHGGILHKKVNAESQIRGCVINPLALLKEYPEILEKSAKQEVETLKAGALPAEWDWRDVGGKSYVTRTLNQHLPKYCGSCWAHAATSSFSDRLKIMRNASWPDIIISVQYPLNCLSKAGTCNGGSDLMLYKEWLKEGIPDETCEVYIAEDEKCTPTNRCRNCFGPPGQSHCFPQPKYLVYEAEAFGFLLGVEPSDYDPDDETIRKHKPEENMSLSMKQEIYQNGPISCVVDADTMFNYTGEGVLNVAGNGINHVVSVAGWGLDETTAWEYWIVRNSWGTYWGDRGWIKIRTGQNAAFIESFCSWVKPAWPPKMIDRETLLDSKDGAVFEIYE